MKQRNFFKEKKEKNISELDNFKQWIDEETGILEGDKKGEKEKILEEIMTEMFQIWGKLYKSTHPINTISKQKKH